MSYKNNIPKKPFAFLIYLSKPYKKFMYLAIFCVSMATFLGMSQGYVFKNVVDSVGGFSSGDSTRWILFWILMFPTVEIFSWCFYRLSGFFGGRWVSGAETYGYRKLFGYLSKHSQAFFDNRFAGSLVSKISVASSGAGSLMESFLWNYLSTFISLIVSIFYVMTIKASLGAVVIGLVLLLIPLNLFLMKFRRIAAEHETKLQNDLKGKTVDVATNMVAVRQFSMIGGEVSSIKKLSELLRLAMVRAWNISEWIIIANMILVGLFLYVVSVITYNAWINGTVSPGDFVLLFTVLSNLMYSLLFIGMSMNRFSKNFGEIKESLGDIIVDYEIKDLTDAEDLNVSNGHILIQDLFFQYKDEKTIFENLNLEIPSKQKVGVIGPSGSGKTTFIKLLLRQYDINAGGIYIDEQNIAEVTQNSLHSSIAVVPQEPILFHRTIRENISYGQNDVNEKDLIEAAKKAEAHDFITKLANGYDTLVGERGVKLSAGQRQRIAIARAILKNAPILILDEATSALDSESEVAIQKALHHLMKEKTVIAIAHRLSTLSEMDRILVIKDGKITEDGDHKTLIKKDGLYTKLWNHQAGGFLSDE